MRNNTASAFRYVSTVCCSLFLYFTRLYDSVYLDMGRNCFVIKCKGNQNRYATDPSKKLPAFFSFPKDPDLFEKWKSVVPPRTFKCNPKRFPTHKDFLCSLHFKKEDVIKYYEHEISINQCQRSEMVMIERGKWKVKPDAVPCYFSDDNPDVNLMLRERETRKRRSTNLSNKEVSKVEIDNNHTENRLNNDQETTCIMDKPETGVMASKLPSVAGIDHNYHLPSIKFTQDRGIAVAELKQKSTPNFLINLNSGDDSSSSNYSESKSDPYSVEQLHQDVLDIALPTNWIFFQNDDDYCTQFLSYDKDMLVKSVKFLGSCLPLVTIRNQVLEQNRVSSKQDIQELLVHLSGL